MIGLSGDMEASTGSVFAAGTHGTTTCSLTASKAAETHKSTMAQHCDL